MPPAMMLSIALVAAALGLIAVALIGAVQPARARSVANLRRGEQVSATPGSVAGTGLIELARRLTLPTLVAALERQHARAGRPADWTVGRLLGLKLIWVPVSLTLVIAMIISGAQVPLILLAIAGAILAYFLPDLLLLSRGQERDHRIELELADTLDQMTIAVEAGLAFDAAMARAAANGKGALAEELTRTLQDMRMGQARRQAFRDLAERTQVADLRQFVRAIMQADANGISLGDVLRTQADEMRLKRRQRAEMKAQQVPVKVVMPLMLCILPVLFIVVMAPAAMSAFAAISGTG